MTFSRNRALVLAITQGNMTLTQASQHFNLSTRHIQRLLTRYHEHGIEGLKEKPRTPHTNPNATPTTTINEILNLRKKLAALGLDCGAHTIHTHLDIENKPSPTTIWRILKKAGAITPQPQKRPKNSYIRFQAELPNGTWQSDFTHWPLADKTDTEIISWLDDHSRYLLHISAHPRITGTTVTATFTQTAMNYGLPASTLTDNGMVYTTRLAAGNKNKNYQPNAFEQLLADYAITQKNGRPGHPTTQGKIERFHQTLKKWLRAQPPIDTLDELNNLLEDFQTIYNTTRPHRSLANKTPHEAYHARPKDGPTISHDGQDWRVRIDKIGTSGTITLRYAGKLRHLGIGRAHRGQAIIALTHGPNVVIINRASGEIIAEFTIDPTRNYQKKNKRKTDT
ncbi:IS481 family transposase [Schaalia turicensis]|uniref:IS481 family transposase n=3 Tax=Actinomycetaceae TaxID=2049 RepID=UPI00369BB73E